MQERLNRLGCDTIDGLRATVAQLWKKCCEEDGIEPSTRFVVFSGGNKYVPFYNRAVNMLLEAETAYRDGGYVGLKIGEKGIETSFKKDATVKFLLTVETVL